MGFAFVHVDAGSSATVMGPNPARFYMKEQNQEWDAYTPDQKSKIAKHNDLVFIDESLDDAGRIAFEIRSLATGQGNIRLKLVRYWNMWGAYKPLEANYTYQMYLYDGWPESTGVGLAQRKDTECDWPDLVDISRDDLKAEIGRVIATFRNDFDGVFFDVSSWDIYIRRAYGLKGVPGCPAPDNFSGFVVNNFKGKSKDSVAGYHQYLQDNVIDPSPGGEKLHLCNGLPRDPLDQDPAYEDKFLAIIDGCQMDTIFVNQSAGKFTKTKWKFQMDTLRKFVTRGRYFLAKVHWPAGGKAATDRLEYGFASYLLGADGQYALFWSTRYIDWENDPIISAPLGSALAEYQLVSGMTAVYVREFENGLVYVNADTVKRVVMLPSGSFKDASTGAAYKGTLTLNAATAKILIRL